MYSSRKRNEVNVFLKPNLFLSKRAGKASLITLTSLLNFVLLMSQIIKTHLETPSLLKESSVCEPLPSHDVSVDLQASPVTYHLVKQVTKRCRIILVVNLGFSYNINSLLPYLAYWQCTVRPTGYNCKTSITERDRTLHPCVLNIPVSNSPKPLDTSIKDAGLTST